MKDIPKAERARRLERLIGADPTEDEYKAMWSDKPKLERLLAQQEHFDERGSDYHLLQHYDLELWRAKIRSELGSLTGVLDGLAICKENSLLLPDWLHDVTPQYLALLGMPDSTEGSKEIRSRFGAERRKLIMQKRAQIVHYLYRSCLQVPNHPFNAGVTSSRASEYCVQGEDLLRSLPYPTEIQVAINNGRIEKNIEVTSIVAASEIASIALRGTWARAEAETIRKDYNEARFHLRTSLEKKKLSKREADFTFWDVAFVRRDTLSLLGLVTAK